MKMKKGFLSILLSLALVLGLMPGLSLTVQAWNGDPYANLVNTTKVVKFDGKDWYLIENNSTAANAGTVTLLAKECVGASVFSYIDNTYSGSLVETFVNNWYTENITANAKTAVNGEGMFLLTIAQANAMMIKIRKCSKASGAHLNYWWLCSPDRNRNYAGCVGGDNGDIPAYGAATTYSFGVRPALKLNLESVIFDPKSNTFSLSPTGGVSGGTLDKNTVTLIYNGQAQELVDAGPVTGGTMWYAVTTENTAPADNLYTTSIPTATEAGTYYVWYKVVGDANHGNTEAKSITVTITNNADPSGGGDDSSAAEFNLASADARAKTVKFKSVKAKKGRKAQISWAKNAKVTGYQLVYSTSRKFTNKTTKKATIKSNKTVKKTIKKLRKGKTYYFKVRPYTKVYNGATGKNVTVYGKWSNVKKCKAKK